MGGNPSCSGFEYALAGAIWQGLFFVFDLVY